MEHIHSLVQQGNLTKVAAEETGVLTWKSFVYGLKKGTLKFVLNASIDTLPTKSNLLKCKKTASDRCNLYNGRETLLHVLSACLKAVRQGRMTWRHDGIINYIAKTVNTSNYKVFADVYQLRTNAGRTISPDILITAHKPDIVIIDEVKELANIFELRIAQISNIEKRHKENSKKIKYLETEVNENTIKTHALEVKIRGFISKENKETLKKSLKKPSHLKISSNM